MVIKYISIFFIFFFLSSIFNFCTSITFFIEEITRLPHRKNVAMNFHVSIWNISILIHLFVICIIENTCSYVISITDRRIFLVSIQNFFKCLGFQFLFVFRLPSFSIFVVIDKDKRKFQVTHVYNLHIC